MPNHILVEDMLDNMIEEVNYIQIKSHLNTNK